MAMVMSAVEAHLRTITFIVTFSCDDSAQDSEEESKQSTASTMINTCVSDNNSSVETSEDFLKLIDYNNELLSKNARDIFSNLCEETHIGSMYENEKKIKAKHPLTDVFAEVAKEVFNEVLMSQDLEEPDENKMNFMEMA